MTPNFKYFRLAYLLLFILVAAACRKTDPVSWDVDVVAPVARTSLTIHDLVPDSLLEIQSDSAVHLVFDNSVFTLSLDTLVDIPDTSVSQSFQLPFGSFAFAGGETIYQTTTVNTYDIGSAQLTDLIIRAGEVQFSLSSTVPQPHQVFYTITNSAEYINGNLGQPFSVVVDMPAGSQGSPAVVNSSFSLANYYIDLSGPNGNSFNEIETHVQIINHPNSDTAHLSQGDMADVTSQFAGVLPEYAQGYFGSQSFDMDPEFTDIDVFNIFQSGTIDIDQVKVGLDIVNGIGIDAGMTIQLLDGTNTLTAASVSLTHSSIGQAINIDRAQDNWGVVTPSVYTIEMNELNSNIDQLVETLPNQLGYDLDLVVNPLGNVSGGKDFFYYDHPFEAVLQAEMPLCLIATDLVLADTVSYNLYKDSVTGQLNYGTFYVFAENSFPLTADLQIFILDNGVITDSLVTDQVITGAPQGGAPVSSTVRLDVDASQVESLYGENIQLIIQTTFNTTDSNPLGQHLKIYDYHQLDLKLTGDFGYRIELE